MAAKIGRSGQPVQNDGGRPWTWPASACDSSAAGSRCRRLLQQIGPMGAQEFAQPVLDHSACVFSGHRQHALAFEASVDARPPQDGVDGLLDELRLAFLDDQNRLLACAKAFELPTNQRIGDVEDIEGDAARAEHVGKTEDLERPQRGIVHAALNDDADVPGIAVKEFIELMLLDEAHRRRPAFLDFLLLVQIACWRQHNPAGIADRMIECVLECERRAQVVARREATRHVAGRIRSSSITGVLEASDSSKLFATARTIDGRFGRGSTSQICDFIAKAWLRSCMIEEPSP
jgi:hypothetical protein